MSKTIQIRDVPEDLHRQIKIRAAEAGKSVSDFLLEELIHLAALPPIADVLKRANVRMTGTSRLSSEELVKLIDEGRNE